MLATVLERDFPFNEIGRFDRLSDAHKAGFDNDQIWSVTESETDDGDYVFSYGPPEHFINLLYFVVTAERHDSNTYYEELVEMDH